MIQQSAKRASELFNKGHSILITTPIDPEGIRWDNRDATQLSDITGDWYDESDGELTYWTETQSTHIGKEC